MDAVFESRMSSKREKLLNQLKESVLQMSENTETNGKSLNQLFSGVCVHIDRVVSPSELELKRMVRRFGGMYLNHFDANRTTHTIASNMAFV